MKNIRNRLQLVFLALIFLGSVHICTAQNSALEFWPETDIWYRINPSWRFSAFIPITKYNESKNRDLNIYMHVDYAWGNTKRVFVRRMVDENKAQQMKGWMVRGFYMKGWSLGENSGTYAEDMLFAEIHKRIPLKGDILLSHRIRTDLRWLGEDSNFSYRFRYRMMIEKEYKAGRSSVVPYVNVEPYWDSRYSTVNRVRAIGGATFSWGPRLAYEANLTYQYDEHYDATNLYALNIILHVFFERAKSKG
jgi:hypothetical protein